MRVWSWNKQYKYAKETWIDGYGGGRLASLKDHCNGKPHMKVLCSFKVSVLKMLGEVG